MIGAWHRSGETPSERAFDSLALDLCAYQLAENEPYARFAATRGISPAHPPRSWCEIPAVPASAFKDAQLATFDARRSERVFYTSGTTTARAGAHYFERVALYDAALLAGFDRLFLTKRECLRFLNLVPNPRYNPHSSLGYMIGNISVLRGDGKAGWFLANDNGVAIDTAAFGAALREAAAECRPVCITGTAFAFAALLEGLQGIATPLAAPPKSYLMETGGFKGKTHAIPRVELYARLEQALGIPQHEIVAEYGMTELTSQYYDAPAMRTAATRIKLAPPWLRTLVVDPHGHECAPEESGLLRHFDLANRSSVIAIDTEDRGYAARGGIVLLGRSSDSPARGCSLDAEDLLRG